MSSLPAPLPVPSRIEFDNVLAVLDQVCAACGETASADAIRIDLTGLTDFDSSVISMLLELARRQGSPVSALNAPPKLTELAELYGVAGLVFGPAAALPGPA